jgi:tetratricopeptide (TPR) repeat protein
MSSDHPGSGGSAGSRDRELIELARRQASDRQNRSMDSILASENTVRMGEGAHVAVGKREVPAHAIPGYEIVREIHRGGQGVVYQAIQKSTRRRVAIKVMHEGPFAGPRDKARFDREVRILGQLDHPNVVTIHDSGSVSGSFYYVMDYISGEPLDLYAAGGDRSIKDILKLFMKICDAVNAAHLKGVIHRDLKPGNIRIHGDGEPRVLDFGLAKVATGDTTGEENLQVMSTTGQFIGSLPWASPEQAEGAHDKIDVRTDVYSLGVILYQMLTGRFPYRVVGNVRDVLDNIVSTVPARPSTINRRINDELDTIVCKALAKDRGRRYQSAGEFGRDIGHYLTGEPIEAKRDSNIYLLKKALGRYKAQVGVTTAFLLLVVFFGIRGDVLRRQAEKAEHRAALSTRILENALTSIDPAEARGKDTELLRSVLETAEMDIATDLRDEPEAQAHIQDIIGRAYFLVAEYDEALPHTQQALETRIGLLGEKHADVAVSHHHLAELLKEMGKYDEAQRHYKDAIDIRSSLYGDMDLDLAEAMNDLGQLYFTMKKFNEGEPLLREALRIRKELLDEEHWDVAESVANLGSLLRDRGTKKDLAEARPMLEKALSIRQALLQKKDPNGVHPHVAVSINKLGLLYLDEGEYAKARNLFEDALVMRKKIHGEKHRLVAVSLHNLALVLHHMGDHEQARELFDRAIAMWEQVLGPRHKDVASGLKSRAALRCDLGEFEGAKADCQRALNICEGAVEESASDMRPTRAAVLLELGRIYLAEGDLVAAKSCLRSAVDVHYRYQEGSVDAAIAKSLLGECLGQLGEDEEARELLQSSYSVIESIRTPKHLDTQRARKRMVEFFEARGEHGEAAKYGATIGAHSPTHD